MRAEEIQSILSGVEIFNTLTPDLLGKISAKLSPSDFNRGTEIIHKGDAGTSMFIIVSGTVKIHDGEHVVATLGPGNFFGEFSLLDAAPRSMSVTAVDNIKVLIIERAMFFELLEEQPAIARKIVGVLTGRLRNQNENIISQLKSREAELSRLVEERTKELRQKNEEVIQKNREITDNVNYAKRIQGAILPQDRLIEECFRDAFVLYIPKDIVSGDFYSFFRNENKAMISAADCTGHGVSGALLSVVGQFLLSKISADINWYEPGKILDRLNEEIITTLNQQNGESNDGMDMAICTIDFEKRLLFYAGANRPLWMVRKGELISYAQNKFPVGGTQILHEENFTTHTIDIQENDCFYIFSDGYADQFGGDQGKKLMTKKFKEVLLEISHMSMQNQKKYLADFFESWKGVNEQVDDVLIIGLKF